MSRKIIDVTPVVTLTLDTIGLLDATSAQRIGEELVDLVKAHVARHAREIDFNRLRCNPLEVGLSFEHDARCEHCNGDWTEDSDVYNGGCCGKDEANSPERLADLRKAIDYVSSGDFHTLDEGKAGRVRIDWPNLMADAAERWFSMDRPAEGVATLLPLIRRVAGSDWCTVWTDPGPDGCSLARLPDSVRVDSAPDTLAGDLLSLIDDMGLTPARQAVA